ncbi:MAG: ImmA/IrrE family metallo-endopeptidase [Candidatus Aureabacteria bacterium]|nr:ImmA/IrrE family metallo-endopeptidase [Candidatus Auribacterota bacterium]
MELKKLGENLRQIRKQRQLTLQELSEQSGIPLNTLGRIERGQNWPSVQWISKLSDALEVPVNALFQEEPKPIIHYRGEKKLSPRLKQETETIISFYSRLEDMCGAQKYHSFPLDIPLYQFSMSDIEEAANQTRELLGIGHAIVFDLIHLLESSGLRVIVRNMPQEITGFSYFSPRSKSINFFLNSKDTAERKIFTLAHELGHVIFHQGGAKYLVYQPCLSEEDLERSARYFASCFLMPEKTVRSTVRQLGIGLSNWNFDLLISIKSRFSVSAQAFLQRLSELDLIQKKQKESMESEIRFHYGQTNYREPGPGIHLRENQRLKDMLLIAAHSPVDSIEAKTMEKELTRLGVI